MRPSIRSTCCWSAVLTMCVAGVTRAQGTAPPASQGTAPPATQGTVAPAAQGTVPPAAQGTVPPASQGTAPPATQGTVPPAAQGTVPPASQGTATQGTAAPAAPETAAPATSPSPSRWSADSAYTVGAGANMLALAAGYPGLDARLIHGLDATTDVNAHIGINYGFEGITRTTRFEFTAQVGIRKELLNLGGQMKLSGKFDPGILAASSPGVFGIKIPLGIELGIPLSKELLVNASFDLPMFFTLGDFNAFYVPLLFGGGVEYLVNPNLAVTGKIRLGPTFGTNNFPTSFTLYALVGVAYRF